MYDIKQFRPTLYVLILLGISGFSLAGDMPGLWVIAVSLILINIWMVRTEQFKAIPGFLADIVAMLAIIYAAVTVWQQIQNRSGSPILTIGQFLVILQIVFIWQQRNNRDFAILLVLSLLLMVAAAISTASLIFGLMLIAYLFLSLFCCLLFHLKTETDEAKEALALPDHRLDPTTLKQDQRHLHRSMRRLTALVSVYAISCAVLVFLFFPRSAAARLFNQWQWRPQEPVTGFSDHVGYQQVARIAQNDDPVATVKVWKDGVLVTGTEPLRLRGMTLDRYNGLDQLDRAAFQWSRTAVWQNDRSDVSLHETWHPYLAQATPRYSQEITLRSTGSTVLFSIAGPDEITPQRAGSEHHLALQYSATDETLQSTQSPLPSQIQYTVTASGTLGAERPDLFREGSWIDPLIAQYARRPDITADLPARRQAYLDALPRGYRFGPTPYDEQIAADIQTHLRTTFSYTLDLSDVDFNGRDPIVAFLYDTKRGHCEYFAGAMTLLCQSLGLDARMVVGFLCDDYNPWGNYYQVRQSHAHAWVEVLTTHGWVTFDPTSSHMAAAPKPTLMGQARHLFDYFEFTWANAVVAYDADNRENLIQNLDTKMTNTAINSSQALNGIRDFFDRIAGWLAMRIVGPLIILLVLSVLGSITWYVYERWRCIAAPAESASTRSPLPPNSASSASSASTTI